MLYFSLQHFQRLSHHRTQGRHLHDERDPALRWLEGFVNCTVLDHSAPVLDRQSVQLFQVSPKRCQCVSQLRPFRGEPLDQTRSSPDKRRSQPVAATLLLHCFVVGLNLSFCGDHCAQLACLARCKCRTRRHRALWCLARFAEAVAASLL